MTKKRYVPTKKLGSKRIDLPLSKKKEYIRRIVTLKQPYKVVRKIYASGFGNYLHYSTFVKWRKTGAAILDPEFKGVNCRASLMENLELEDEEKKDLEAEDEVQEVPVTKKKPKEEETKKIQRQITSFFFKK
jgi:hypothetical protein